MGKRTFNYITHIRNTSDHRPKFNRSWIDFWKEEAGQSSPKCCIYGCPNKADRGAHVYLDEERSWWIVPVCSECNPPDNSSWDVKANTIAVEARGSGQWA
ncbi:hypothetical protein NHP190012_03610 [Helicobacter sp. NHP19-012]|uniref:HNH endonuclease n=1 Tax=Helicobacter gastrofelis TaxID=2849642 RepID=A0ABM7SDB6_9HELI|nr:MULTISPECIES: hypothetical protein [unclassified Helicobacter]BCZ18719.1 hypothetical protein NHP190012_03610 [Helicobacter sp. NHP19-012]GMB96135.1 hypothetical protein NHP22001_07240 [Helicobacter sp. NHP22-001]